MRFKTKLLLLTSLSLLAGIALMATIALLGINNLNDTASDELEKGLLEANQQFYQNYIQSNTQRTELLLNQMISEVQFLAGFAQNLEDNKDSLKPLYDLNSSLAYFNNNLVRDPKTGVYQTPKDNNQVVTTIWPKEVNADGVIKPEVLDNLHQSSLLDLIFPVSYKTGIPKDRVFYSGPPDNDLWRSLPWFDLGGNIPQGAYPGYQTSNYWDYEPRQGMLKYWNRWVSDPSTKAGLANEVTVVPPYQSGTTKQVVMVLHNPIWSKDRKTVQGSIGLVVNLNQLTSLVRGLKVANSGFAFLAKADTSVLAIKEGGDKVLGLPTDTPELLQSLTRKLSDSNIKSVAGLQLPLDNNVGIKEININGKDYEVFLSRLAPINVYDKDKGINAESFSLGFVVPKDEILAISKATQSKIDETTTSILLFQLLATLVILAVVVTLVFWLARRLTGSLVLLTAAATRIQLKNYDTQVEIKSKDEFGQLGQAFNGMAQEIKEYTQNLEALVKRRTIQLEAANEEITDLNNRLKTENVRMKAELDITKQLQQMILPRETELSQIKGLDVAGFMEPADEVGGDYYDVLQQNGHVKIGIGDVVGHGLESGVLMIMVQTAVRTLLASNETDPARFLSVLNRTIYDNVQRMHSDKNLTLSLLDYNGGSLRMSGQHENAIVIRNNGELELIETMDLGFPIGLEEDIEAFVSQMEIPLYEGDIVVLYTDGVTEAEDMEGNQYGLDRICEVAKAHHQETVNEIKQAIIDDLRIHIGKQQVYDDITLVVLKQRGETETQTSTEEAAEPNLEMEEQLVAVDSKQD